MCIFACNILFNQHCFEFAMNYLSSVFVPCKLSPLPCVIVCLLAFLVWMQCRWHAGDESFSGPASTIQRDVHIICICSLPCMHSDTCMSTSKPQSYVCPHAYIQFCMHIILVLNDHTHAHHRCTDTLYDIHMNIHTDHIPCTDWIYLMHMHTVHMQRYQHHS